MMKVSPIVGAVITGLMAVAGTYGLGVKPVATERDETALNSEVIRTELQECMKQLRACWAECR